MRKVEATILIHSSSDQIIKAFTDINMLHGWWNVERAFIEKHIGGVYTLIWSISEKGFGYVSTGIIKNYNADSVLEIDKLVYLNPEHQIYGPMSLIIKATKQNGITELYLCQDGYQNGEEWDWYYNVVKDAWPVVLQTLKNYLEKLSS